MTEESRDVPPTGEAEDAKPAESSETATTVSAPPEPVADRSTDATTSADSPSSEVKPTRQIKIGTQRPGSVMPKAKPLPLPAVAVNQGEPTKPAVEKRPPRPRPEQGEERPEAETTAPVADPVVEVAAPPPPPRDKVELPSLREMSDELEREIQDALGEQSIDALVEVDTPIDDAAEPELRSRRTGRIVAMHNDDVFIEFGQRHQGVVSMRQLPEPPAVGEEIEVILAGFNAEEGLFLCAVPGAAVDVEDWSQLVEGTVIEVNVTGHNKGGLECQTHGIRGFIPAGQISLYRVEDFSEFVGQKLTCVVTEANERKQNLVLSRRAVLEREKAEAREKLLAELAPGQVRDGIVRKLMDFGAFVDIGGADGLVHVSRISWGRVNHPSEVLKEGEAVRVRVEKIDPDTQKIGLSMRDLVESPWENAERNYPQGTVIRGKVTKVMEFGAFVELEPGVEGLIHISELAHHRVFRVTDVAKEGDEVEAEVLSVDREKQRISLSMKAMQAGPVVEEKKDDPEETEEEAARPKRKSNVPLQGGLGQSAGGEEFGLKW